MAMSNVVLIAAIEAQHAAEQAAGKPIENRARAAMKAVQHHWVCTSESDQFAAACEGLARTCSPDEVERIAAELRAGMALNALLSGVPVDIEAALAEKEAGPEPIGLSKLWREVAHGEAT